MQQRTKAAHNEHYKHILFQIKEERKEKLKMKHLFENVITIGFYNLVY